MTATFKFRKPAASRKYRKNRGNATTFRKSKQVNEAGTSSSGQLPPEFLNSVEGMNRTRESLTQLATTRG